MKSDKMTKVLGAFIACGTLFASSATFSATDAGATAKPEAMKPATTAPAAKVEDAPAKKVKKVKPAKSTKQATTAPAASVITK